MNIMLPFGGPSDWTPPPETIPQSIHKLIAMDKLTIKKYYRNTREISNTSQLENEALSQLQKDKTIVIKPADKGGSGSDT